MNNKIYILKYRLDYDSYGDNEEIIFNDFDLALRSLKANDERDGNRHDFILQEYVLEDKMYVYETSGDITYWDKI